MKKIGVLGGTFDPVHIGHLILAEQTTAFFGFSKTLFVPSGNPPHKDVSRITPTAHRVNMIKLAIDGNPHFEASDAECDETRVSYTYDTLNALQSIYGADTTLYYIIGSDVLKYITRFINYQQVIDSCVLVASTRPGEDLVKTEALAEELKNSFDARIELFKFPEIEISSSLIREKISRGESVRYMIPDAVIDYIGKHGLYKTGEGTAVPGYWESIPTPRVGEPRHTAVDDAARRSHATGARHTIAGTRQATAIGDVDIEAVKRLAESQMSARRYSHSLRVMELSVEMARIFGADPVKAALAGLLHDYMREAPFDELISVCESGGIAVNDYELYAPVILHAPASAVQAETILGGFGCCRGDIDDISKAIKYHTTGCADMGLPEKILFVADAIEPGREHETARIAREMLNRVIKHNQSAGVKTLTVLPHEYARAGGTDPESGGDKLNAGALDNILLYILERDIEYIIKDARPLLHPDTVHARNRLAKIFADNIKRTIKNETK